MTGAGTVADAGPGEIWSYDARIVTQMNRLEDRIAKFALQNYVTSGAVFLAYFGGKITLATTLIALVVINLNFVLAIAHTAYWYKLLFSMHHVTRNYWLEQKPRAGFWEALRGNANAREVLDVEPLSFENLHKKLELSHPAVRASFLPTLGAVLLFFV